MAVNKLVFGGVDSSTYGIYISGEGVFNAPKRAVEMIEIPGRNGSFALDQGRFENITVTYPAFTYETSMATFQQNLANFRNALASKKGYQRLTDTFHTDEYRMAVFKDGLDIDPIKYNTASKFNITFDCKPQRWLTSGESAVTIANSGDTITNPTLFESSPLLEVEGYGNINFNGYSVHLDSGMIGDITLASDAKMSAIIDESLMNIGDTFTVNLDDIQYYVRLYYPFDTENTTSRVSDTITDSNNKFVTSYNNRIESYYDQANIFYKTVVAPLDFTIGTDSEITNTVSGSINCVSQRGTSSVVSFTISYSVKYTASTHKVEFKMNGSSVSSTASYITDGNIVYYGSPRFITIIGHSTVSMIGNPTYIDCDLGEAYKIESGSIISLNAYIDLGSQLPTLSAGSNEITFDNTVTDLKITPRWWKI